MNAGARPRLLIGVWLAACGGCGGGAEGPDAAVTTSGTLDPSFAGGLVVADLGERDLGRRVAIQPDGKIVVVSWLQPTGRYALRRYLADGSLDDGFGTNGQVLELLGSDTAQIRQPTALLLVPNDQILVVGRCGELCAVRHDADGSVDETYGTLGYVSLVLDGTNGAEILDAQVVADGSVLLAGQTGDLDLVLAKLTPEGDLDASFQGTGWMVVADFGARALVDHPDGGSVVVALDMNLFGAAVMRYDAGGFPVDGFGTAGRIFFQDLVPWAMVRQADGGLVVGSSEALVRVTAAGEPDVAFGSAGRADFTFTPGGFPGDFGGLASQADGKVVIASCETSTHELALARFDGSGALDETFGTAGVVLTTPSVDEQSRCWSDVAIQADGKIVAVGSTGDSASGDLVIGRFLP
jgi:uncharacterized delta-60 repeat protein